MAHFAQLDKNNKVVFVTVIDNENIMKDGAEDEATGSAYCRELMGGRWIQASYNGKFRGCYPGEGYTYDAVKDVFIPPPAVERL
jgi:hypothetical protein